MRDDACIIEQDVDTTELGDDVLLRVLSQPGFSTAAQVSDVSGRGMGMDAVTSRVRFQQFNLLKPYTALGKFDVIFCRNVLIYFDDRAKQKAVSLLYDALRPGGYLFIGLSESLHSVTRAFKPVAHNRVIVYQRT